MYVLINITVYSTQKKKKECLSHIGYVCLMSVVYNPDLQLQMVGHFVVVLWLLIYYKRDLKY